jgi:hypothetical protein
MLLVLVKICSKQYKETQYMGKVNSDAFMSAKKF